MSFAHAASPGANGAGIASGPRPSFVGHEARKTARFPLNVQAQYIAAGGAEGHAPIRDISSGGVFLKTDRIVRDGEWIRVFIDWPILLDNRCPLRLVIDGKVLRSNQCGTAVKLTKYAFRIRPKLIAPQISA